MLVYTNFVYIAQSVAIDFVHFDVKNYVENERTIN